MFPLAMGVVMALFGMSNGLYAAQQTPLPLNKKFFWTERQPIVIETAVFKQLKENEIRRAVNNKALLALLMQGGASVQELQAKLKIDENFTIKSVELFKQLRKQKKVESPKLGSGCAEVKSIFNRVNEARIGMMPEAESAQRTILNYTLKGDCCSAREGEKVSTLLTKVQKERLALFAHFKIDASLREEACTSYHMNAFPHLLFLDAQYHELEKNILNCF